MYILTKYEQSRIFMQLISCHSGKLQTLSQALLEVRADETFRTGLASLDEISPGGAFSRGAVHELLLPAKQTQPTFVAMLLAKSSLREGSAIVYCDPNLELYPPAVAAMGIPLQSLYLLSPKDQLEQNWAIAECLRCPGVSAVIASPKHLSRVEARRLQLAAEQGKSVGILMRSAEKSLEYAAATRWRVSPSRGKRTVQRWMLQLVHGHGGRVGTSVLLEHHRDTHITQAHSRSSTRQLADRSIRTA